jgi:nucleolar GTP-binding protein
LQVPTLVLVGAPNVGKSSLVRLLSSGQPEVQNYPFTTRGVKMGHFFVRGERHVVTDTPGLLNRDEEVRRPHSPSGLMGSFFAGAGLGSASAGFG